MKHYFILVFNVLFTIATFGFIMPGLVSASDTILVATGLAWLVAVYIPIMYGMNRDYIVKLVNKCKGLNQ